MGIFWAVVDVLSAVAKAAVWVMEKADEDTKELRSYRFERQATEDQKDGD